MISRRFLFSFFLLPFLPGLSQALAAPGADVAGKSVVLRWTENRQQRINNSPELRAVAVGRTANLRRRHGTPVYAAHRK